MSLEIDDLKCCYNCKNIRHNYEYFDCVISKKYDCKHGVKRLLKVERVNNIPVCTYDNPKIRLVSYWEYDTNRYFEIDC